MSGLHAPSDIPGCDPDEELPFDPQGEFDGCLDALEFTPEPPASQDRDRDSGSDSDPCEQ